MIKNILYQFCNDSMSPLIYKSNDLISKIVLFNDSEFIFKQEESFQKLFANNIIDSINDSTSLLFNNKNFN
jgi:hypothetical protein